MSAKKRIECWLDDTSDCDDPIWCVSLCECDGNEIRCLSTHEEEDDAEAEAKLEAENRGLTAYRRDSDGRCEEI